MMLYANSCERPSKSSASVFFPSSVSNSYSVSTGTQGSSRRCSVALRRSSPASASRFASSSRAACHSSRVAIVWSGIVLLVGRWPIRGCPGATGPALAPRDRRGGPNSSLDPPARPPLALLGRHDLRCPDLLAAPVQRQDPDDSIRGRDLHLGLEVVPPRLRHLVQVPRLRAGHQHPPPDLRGPVPGRVGGHHPGRVPRGHERRRPAREPVPAVLEGAVALEV